MVIFTTVLWIGLGLCALVAAMVGLFYLEENWRGDHVWAVTKTEFEAKGETFDYAELIPPPVPDKQNLGALPLFQLEKDPKDGFMQPVALKRALANLSSISYRSHKIAPDSEVRMINYDQLRTDLARQYQAVIKPADGTPETSTLDQINALCPELEEIRTASQARPIFRLAQDYTSVPAEARPLGLTTAFISVAKAFTMHAIVALHEGKSDSAMDDMRLLFKLEPEMRREPLLVAGLVAIGMSAIQNQAIWEGIQMHSWNDAQLAELEESLKQVEFFSAYQNDMRGEAVAFFIPIMDRMEKEFKISDILGMSDSKEDEKIPNWKTGKLFMTVLFRVEPRGWFALSKAWGTRYCMAAAEGYANARERRFYPERSVELEAMAKPKTFLTPGEILRGVAAAPISYACCSFAQGQFNIDAIRICCMAERYRLAHGAYPDSLAKLAEANLGDIPQEVVNGEPYHYILHPDGTFLIYSVGWDLKDDGGNVAYKADDSTTLDKMHGDWVWPSPPKPGDNL